MTVELRSRSRIVGDAVRHRGEQEWLEPSSCCRPSPDSVVRPAVAPSRKPRERESAGRPDQVADALEAEAGIEDVERQHRHAVRAVASRGGDPGGNRAGLGDAFLEDLAVLRFLVVEQLVLVLRFVELAVRRVDRRPGGTATACRRCAPRRRRSARCACRWPCRAATATACCTNTMVVDCSRPPEPSSRRGTCASCRHRQLRRRWWRAPAHSRRAPGGARAGISFPGCRRPACRSAGSARRHR